MIYDIASKLSTEDVLHMVGEPTCVIKGEDSKCIQFSLANAKNAASFVYVHNAFYVKLNFNSTGILKDMETWAVMIN